MVVIGTLYGLDALGLERLGGARDLTRRKTLEAAVLLNILLSRTR